MRKTDKKIDNQIRTALNKVCHIGLSEIPGFSWLTHTVNYKDFPKSLIVTCVFESKSALEEALGKQYETDLNRLIVEQLNQISVEIKSVKQIKFITEKQ